MRRITGPSAGSTGVPRVLPRKIFALTLAPPVVVTIIAAILVQVEVSQRMREMTLEQLSTARSVWQDTYRVRGQDLATQAVVVARDPKFFAMLAQPDLSYDASYRATLEALSDDFKRTLGSDVFEIFDERGLLLAGTPRSGPLGTDLSEESDIRAALGGNVAHGTLGAHGNIYQIVALPVVVRGQIVGILRHGKRLDQELTEKLRSITRCEVTILNGGQTVATSKILGDGDYLSVVDPLPDPLGSFEGSLRLERSREPEKRLLALLRMSLLGMGTVILTLATLLAWWVTRRLSEPVRQLVTAAARLEQGEEDLPIRIRTGDELEYLGRRFEEMRLALRRQIRSLEELDRMKSTFLTLASHELRTPVTIINGALYMMNEAAPRESSTLVAEALQTMAAGTSRLQRVVEQITDMSLIDRHQMALTMGPLDLRDLLKPLAAHWRRTTQGRDLRFRARWPEEALPVWGDPERIRQAAGNLLHNAMRFTPDGGEIDLTVTKAGGTISIAVEDTGIGIQEEERERVFERFYEVQDIESHSSGGTGFGTSGLGMGLAIARGIVQAHAGKIRYEPRAQGGSRFVIDLPALAAPIELSSKADMSAHGMAA
jgi:signal transduction histidine kinase